MYEFVIENVLVFINSPSPSSENDCFVCYYSLTRLLLKIKDIVGNAC